MAAAVVQKRFSNEFVHEVRDEMLQTLQSAARECMEDATKKMNEEMLRLHCDHQQVVHNLQLQVKVLTERQASMLGHDGVPKDVHVATAHASIAKPAQPRPSQSPVRCVQGQLLQADRNNSDLKVAPPPRAKTSPAIVCQESSCPQNKPELCVPPESGSAPVTPARHITLVMTPASSQTCSSSPSSCHSTVCASGEKKRGIGLLASSPSEIRTPTCTDLLPEVTQVVSPSGSKHASLDSPSNDRTVLLADVTPPRSLTKCNKGGNVRPLQHESSASGDQAASSVSVEGSNAVERTPPAKIDCMASPAAVPAETPLIGTPREHVRQSFASPRKPTELSKAMPHEVSAASGSGTSPFSARNKIALLQDKSPTILEPDTIEILRNALVDSPEKPRGPVMLPPAAVQGRSAESSSDSTLPTPQGSPLLRALRSENAASDTSRSNSTPRHPVKTPKLSNIFTTPAGSGTCSLVAPSTQDAAKATSTSPPRSKPNRRSSWPSTPRNPVRAVVAKLRESSGASDDWAKMNPSSKADGSNPCNEPKGNGNTGTKEAAFGSLSQSCKAAAEHLAKLQPVTPAPPAAPSPPAARKTMPENVQEGGIIDGTTLHGVASPLRRRWLGVLSGAPSTSAVTPKPPAQRL